MAQLNYQPGVCNIGGAEVKRRRQVAQMGTALFLSLAAYLVVTDKSPSSVTIAFLPALLASVGFVQSRMKFCFAFGLLGTFNFAELGKISKVATKAEIKADRRKALLIIFQSIGLALVATALLAAVLSL